MAVVQVIFRCCDQILLRHHRLSYIPAGCAFVTRPGHTGPVSSSQYLTGNSRPCNAGLARLSCQLRAGQSPGPSRSDSTVSYRSTPSVEGPQLCQAQGLAPLRIPVPQSRYARIAGHFSSPHRGLVCDFPGHTHGSAVRRMAGHCPRRARACHRAHRQRQDLDGISLGAKSVDYGGVAARGVARPVSLAAQGPQ